VLSSFITIVTNISARENNAHLGRMLDNQDSHSVPNVQNIRSSREQCCCWKLMWGKHNLFDKTSFLVKQFNPNCDMLDGFRKEECEFNKENSVSI